jgi:hypothetical protein
MTAVARIIIDDVVINVTATRKGIPLYVVGAVAFMALDRAVRGCVRA